MSTHWLQAVPMSISGRKFFTYMISLDIKDYNVILDIDFLAKYGASNIVADVRWFFNRW